MKPLILATLPLALVAACTTTGGLPAPGTVADRSVLDERLALSAELAYQAAATALLTANRAGIISASARPRLKAADERAYAAVLAVRAAYRAGNSYSYAEAATRAQDAVAAFLTAIKG